MSEENNNNKDEKWYPGKYGKKLIGMIPKPKKKSKEKTELPYGGRFKGRQVDKNTYQVYDIKKNKYYNFPSKDDAMNNLFRIVKESMPEPEDPYKGAKTEFDRANVRMSNPDLFPGYANSYTAIKDSTTIYDATKDPRMKPSTLIAYEAETSIAEDLKKTDKAYEKYIRELDPEQIGQKIKAIEDLLGGTYADEKKYKTMRGKLLKQLEVLNTRLNDYDPDSQPSQINPKAKPKVNY